MVSENQIVTLVNKYRHNSLNNKEQQELFDWINENDANRLLFEQLTSNDLLFEELKKIYKVDKEAGWQKIQDKLSSEEQ